MTRRFPPLVLVAALLIGGCDDPASPRLLSVEEATRECLTRPKATLWFADPMDGHRRQMYCYPAMPCDLTHCTGTVTVPPKDER